MAMGDLNKDFLLVAAIDFGTAYSGYAFSTKSDFKSDPLKVSSNTWGAGSLMSLKTPTCVLFDKDKKFDSFGFEAEDKYGDLAADNKHRNHYFFRRFKMKLFDKLSLRRRFMIEDECGKKMQAMDVFSACVKFLRDHLMEKCRQQLPDIKDDEIRWVLTVPAIWNDASKQFMREAAEKAGIPNNSLLIALEPEAASLCCRHLPITTMKGCSSGFVPFSPNSKYLVFDAGGGTVDITVHEVQQGGSLRELYKANGGNWGGTYIDKAFRDMLADIVGNDIMSNFADTKMSDYIDLLREFEVKKRTFKNDMTTKITIRVPIALNDDFKKAKGMDIKDHIDRKPEYKDKISWVGDKIRMQVETAKGLFNEACHSAAQHLKELFLVPEVKDVPTILMVGGFSESPLLQDIIKEKMKGKKVIVPADPGLAVLKGAVIFGHDPSVISVRRCRYTYGVRTSNPFKEGVHPASKRLVDDDGDVLCIDMFDKHVQVGQPVEYGKSQATQSYAPTRRDQKTMTFSVYATEDKEPVFVTDSSCKELGSLIVDMSGSGTGRTITVQMTFSGTELHVEAHEKDTGKRTKAKLEFLG